MKIIFLSSKDYTDSKIINYGDCIIIDTQKELYIYDCGSDEHANRVIDYMDKNGYDKAVFILSHNDADHFDGLELLIENKKVSKIYTTLLLKYKDEILDRIGDGRKTRDSVSKQILELYDNIAKLSGAPIYDIYEDGNDLKDIIKIVGPDKEYMLDTVAKRLDSREGNQKDGETPVNATSIQISVLLGNKKMLLCGDCSFAAVEDIVLDYDAIQLPHHGKVKQAELIFEKKSKQIGTLYVVSDNTGSTNGGSDDLNVKGHRVKNTKKLGDVVITEDLLCQTSYETKRTLGEYDEIFFTKK